MTRWLTVVGIGEDGMPGLAEPARAALEGAEVVFGGARQLSMLAGAPCRQVPWPSPLSEGIEALLARRGQPTCVLASGDPMWYGIGGTLARTLEAEEMTVLPALSAFQLAAARLGWPLEEAATISLHGRPAALIEPNIQPGARLLVLSGGADTPAEVAGRLAARGFGESRLWVMEHLGGARERIREGIASGFGETDIAPLNLVAVRCKAGPEAALQPTAPGLADAAFDHDGQITKREVRAATLARLMPMPRALLWDIGAGSGSVAIEWMRAAPRARAIAVEADPGRLSRLKANAEALGVPGVETVVGQAPAALAGLAAPDAVFVGGGLAETGEAIIGIALSALRPGGRLVANAVTLASEARLLAAHAVHGGELVRIAISRAEPVGRRLAWRPAMPVTQWAWRKPRETAR